MNVPSPLLGYTRERLNQSNPPKTPLPLPASVLRMFVTMEPILAPPEPMQQSVKCITFVIFIQIFFFLLFLISSLIVLNLSNCSIMHVVGLNNYRLNFQHETLKRLCLIPMVELYLFHDLYVHYHCHPHFKMMVVVVEQVEIFNRYV